MMLARATDLVSIPEELAAEEAAPILCAGIATFNALKKCGAEAGDVVAVFGIGGLGHICPEDGLQGHRHRSRKDIPEDALALGAHVYIDTDREDAAAALGSMGGAVAMIATIGKAEAVSALTSGLAPMGRLMLLGAGKDRLAVAMGHLVAGERSVLGSIIGSSYENENALAFSVLAGVRPMIETVPLEEAPPAVQRIKSGDAKFRMVLTMRGP